MNNISGISGTSTAELLKQKDRIEESSGGVDFAQHLKTALGEENARQITAEQAVGDMASGQVKDLHQAALAISKAETSMKLMLEIRNKALSAYKEIGRTQL